MPMMAMPARIASSFEYARTIPPSTLAPAPSAMNTVEKPSTNNPAATTASRRTETSGSASSRRSSDVPAKYTRYGGTSGSTQGDRKLKVPAASAAARVTSEAMAG